MNLNKVISIIKKNSHVRILLELQNKFRIVVKLGARWYTVATLEESNNDVIIDYYTDYWNNANVKEVPDGIFVQINNLKRLVEALFNVKSENDVFYIKD